MNDLELHRLCAEAMGLTVTENAGVLFLRDGLGEYRPLHNDEQAMALVNPEFAVPYRKDMVGVRPIFCQACKKYAEKNP